MKPHIYFFLLIFLASIVGCQSPAPSSDSIHELIDQWHEAAATADEDVFFGSMTEDCIYLGTDASERWFRDELKSWSATYFEREKAWDFTPKDRVVYFSADGRTAWFEELLETWMGVCRGSGVVEKQGGEWKIKHYHLGVTIHNDLIQDFIELVKKDPMNAVLLEGKN